MKRALLLDFDGPICAMFGGCPAPLIAAELIARVEPPMPQRTDPLAVLRWVGEHRPAATAEIEDALIKAEVTAAATAVPTPHAREVLESAHKVAVVSNNSAAAIEAYLEKHGLTAPVIVGRPYAQPSLMKPHPHSLLVAIEALGVTPADCTMVGDSLTDIEAARAAGIAVIGYANRPGKVLAGADTVITSMEDLARWI